MQPLKQIMVTPKERIGGFTVGKSYGVLAIGMDINYQPLFTIPDDTMQIKNVSAERFLYKPYGTSLPLAGEEQEVDYEVVDDDDVEHGGPFTVDIEEPEEKGEDVTPEGEDPLDELKGEQPAENTPPKSTKRKKSTASSGKKSPARPKKSSTAKKSNGKVK